MTESLTLYCNQVASPPLPCKQTAYTLLPYKNPVSLPLLCDREESSLLRAKFPSSTSSYGNQRFPYWFCKKCPIYLPQGRLYFWSKRLYAWIKRLYAKFKNFFWCPGLVIVKSISCCVVNPESHLSWKMKAKSSVKHVKGVNNLLNLKWCSLRVRDLPLLSIHTLSYPFTSGKYFCTPVPQGFPLRAYSTKTGDRTNTIWLVILTFC